MAQSTSYPDTPAALASEPESGVLPQYGFGAEYTFAQLAPHNRFLFRVHTPRARSPFDDPTDPYFLGKRFKRGTDALPAALRWEGADADAARRIVEAQRFEDVARHMDWTTRAESPYVTTSFSFAWAIWEAVRRRKMNVKHDVEIAVIDARMVADRAVTALELLRKAAGKQKDKDYWKWYRFALESQDVLVFGHIPGEAIYASVPIDTILHKLPSYFLSDDEPSADALEPADGAAPPHLAWDPSERAGGATYRRFCDALTARFLRGPDAARAHASTAGAVRLAVCLLHPWFRAHAPADLPAAAGAVRALAAAVARWPAAWWVRAHPETRDARVDLVRAAAEEILEADRVRLGEEAARLWKLVEELDAPAPDAWRAMPTPPDSDDDELPEDGAEKTHLDGGAEPAALHDAVAVAAVDAAGLPAAVEAQKEAPQLTGTISIAEFEDMDGIIAIPPELPLADGKHSARPAAEKKPHMKDWTLAEVSSWGLTTLLCGVAVTLLIMSSQRPRLLNHLT